MIDNGGRVGMIDNIGAKLIYRHKSIFADGSIMEMIIWSVPIPVKGSVHPYKYRLFWGRHGRRIVGYDNERGKAIPAISMGGNIRIASSPSRR